MDLSGIAGSPNTPQETKRNSPVPGSTPTKMEEAQSDRQDILKGVVAYVEVRSGNDNRSRCIIKELTLLGAEIVQKFNQEVTHVIFKDGKKSTLDKAKKKGVHLVSVLWVDSCKQTQSRVDESLHEPALSESMTTPVPLGRHLKKSKSMQPKNFDEEVASSAERGKNRRKRLANQGRWKALESPYSPHLPRTIYAAETQPRSPSSLDLSFSPNIIVPETPASMRRKLQELREKQALIDKENSSTDTPVAPDILTPLQRRLFESSVSGAVSGAESPCIPATPVLNLAQSLSYKHEHNKDSDSGSSSSSDNSNNKKKHKLFNPETGPLPPESLIQPTIATNRKQTKPMFLSPAVDKRKGPRAKKRGRVSEGDKEMEGDDDGTDEQSETKPSKRPRRTRTKSPGELSGSAGPMNDNVLRVKRSSRRQSVASSTPSQTEEPLVKRRGRRSLAVAITPLRISPTERNHTRKTRKPAETVSKPTDECTRENPSAVEENLSISHEQDSTNRSTSVGFVTAIEESLNNDSCPQVKRRGRRSLAPQKTNKQTILEENVFNETSEQNTVIKGRSSQDSILTPTERGQLSVSVSPKLSLSVSTDDSLSVSTVAPVNRRRSARIHHSSISNFRKEFNFLPVTPDNRKPRKSVMKSTPSSEYGSQGKCPADLDSTADDSVLALLPNKKKIFKSVGSAIKRKDNEGATTGTNKTQVKSTKAPVKSLGCLSHSRRSLEDFHPSQLTTKTKKAANKAAEKLDVSASGSDDSETKIKRKGKSQAARACCSSSSSSDESTSQRSKDRPKFSMVTTSMHYDEQDVMRSIIETLKGYRVTSSVKDDTYHVICGDVRRTLNVLYAISRGCWLLSKHWVLESLEQGQWVDEEPYELHDYFPAAQAARIERQACEPKAYCSGIFADIGNIFVADQTSPPHHHLVALLKLNGGKVTQCTRKADIFIGTLTSEGKPSLLETWVLDSITSHRCLPIDTFHLKHKERSERSTSPDF